MLLMSNLRRQIDRAKREANALEKKINDVIVFTLTQYANRILQSATSRVSSPLVNVRASYGIEIDERNVAVRIYNKNDMIAYLEFGTGSPETVKRGLSAKEYLSSQPQEVVDEAWKFFKTGRGTIAAQPHLFPSFYEVYDEIVRTIDKRVQDILDKI